MTAPLDDTIQIVTPENIAFQYRVAGPFLRLPAYLIDVAIRVLIFLVGALVIGLVFGAAGLAAFGWGVIAVLVFLLSWFYGGLFETFWNGQTPGKRIMGLRVLTIDGRPINGMQAVLRNVLRVVDSQPGLFYLLGLVAASANPRFQRLGDLACGTMVVVEERRWWYGPVRTRDREVRDLAEQLPAAFQASRTLARTLAAYVRRREGLSPSRRYEIARHLAGPLRRYLHLPSEHRDDLFLQALYHRTFIAHREQSSVVRRGSPFRSPAAQPQEGL